MNNQIEHKNHLQIAILGLGEAGSHFANDLVNMGVNVIGFDPNPVRFLHENIVLAANNLKAARNADIIFSVNLSAVSEEIAREVMPVLNESKIYVEMNTSSPDKKIAIYETLKSTGVQYVDLAIMAPVPPKGIKTSFLASGNGAKLFQEKVKDLDLNLSILSDVVGEASTRKLLRSIVYKGIAAVICEVMEAGQKFELENYIREQISSVIGGNDDLIDRFVEGSKTHALRRMHEMEAVVEMLAPPAPRGGAMTPIMSMATKENLKKLAKIEEEAPPLGAGGAFGAIPFMQIRGGSSKGLFFNAEDLPQEETIRNQAVLLAMEGTLEGDSRQIDGLGGANLLTSKVAIVSLSKTEGVDLDYLFLQVVVGKGQVSTTQTCGNILAGVLPFAIESGMIKPSNHGTPPATTSAKIQMMNTGGVCEVTVQTPNGKMEYAGNAKVDGVPGTAAPIICNYLGTEGSTCGALLPTGNVVDVVDGVEITCIDNGMPVVLIRATDFKLTGNESKEVLEANDVLKEQIEKIRIKAGEMMNLGDVSQQTIPKMCLISAPQQGGILNTRMFIPHVVHEAIGVLAAVSVATACIIPESITSDIAKFKDKETLFSIEHPTGKFTVNLDYTLHENKIKIHNSGVIRTARLLSKGEVFIPAF